MTSWSCPHEAEGLCRRVDGACCRPGMRGCVLAGKVTFEDGQIPAPRWPTPDGRRPAREPGAGEPEPDDPAPTRA